MKKLHTLIRAAIMLLALLSVSTQTSAQTASGKVQIYYKASDGKPVEFNFSEIDKIEHDNSNINVYTTTSMGNPFVMSGVWDIDRVVFQVEDLYTSYAVSETNCFLMDGAQAKFPMKLTWDDEGRFRIMRNTNVDLTKITWTSGVSKIRFYKATHTTGQIQLNDPNWNNLGSDNLQDWNGGAGVLETTLTQDAIDCITGVKTDTWSETAFIIQGSDLTVTKIELIP